MTSDHESNPAERPLWLNLDLAAGPLFGVLHRAAQPCTSGVLICPPFGWREECSHRGLAVWARTLAAAGFTTLRIDLPGTRNSAGGPTQRTPATWIAAISAAASWLREQEGLERVSLLGVELGGLLALSAVAAGAAIDDLILWATARSGRAAVRELKMHAAVVAARYAVDDPQPHRPVEITASRSGSEPATPNPPDDEQVEVVGYVLGAGALRELAALAPERAPATGSRAQHALVLGRDTAPADRSLVDRLRAWNFETTVAPGPGYDALMEDPQFSQPPTETIAATVAWLREHRADGGQMSIAASRGAARTRAAAPAVVSATAKLRIAGIPIRETALRLPTTAAPLFAVISEPHERERAPLCAVLLNPGSVSHAGPNRAWVELSRRWAARGVTTVRVDLPGIGESPGDAAPYRDTSFYYDRSLTEQTLALLDALADRGLPGRFTLAGLCSGSYWALHATLRDPRVCGAMLLNLWAFHFSPELVIERAPGDALARLRHGGLRRLVRGDFSRERLVRALRSIEPGRIASGTRRPIERSQSAPIEADLDRLDARGVALTLLFGSGEPLRLQLERQGVAAAVARWRNLRIEQIPSRDHMFRSLALQRHVHAALDGALDRSLLRAIELQDGDGEVAVATA